MAYSRPIQPEATLNDEELELENNITMPPDESLNPEEKTWKKRYGDLRSYTSKQLNDMKAQLKEVTEKLNTTVSSKMELPARPEDVEEWTKKYPQVAAIVETLALQKARKVNETVEAKLETLRESQKENDRDKAMNKLKGIHTDFDDISASEVFHNWLASKSKRTQDTIYENDTDFEAAAETISLFKLETNWGRARKNPKDEARNAAKDIPNRANPRPSNGVEPMFRESEILSMSAKDFEKNEEAIEKAQREGRIEYDVTNAKEAARG
jgi:hypothetical protein